VVGARRAAGGGGAAGAVPARSAGAGSVVEMASAMPGAGAGAVGPLSGEGQSSDLRAADSRGVGGGSRGVPRTNHGCLRGVGFVIESGNFQVVQYTQYATHQYTTGGWNSGWPGSVINTE